MSKLSDFLGKVAPTIATLFGGPLAGMAVTAVGDALGLKGSTQKSLTDLIESGQMTGEQLLALKRAEIDIQTKLKELDIDAEKLATEDRNSARTMQTATRSSVPAVLAISLTLGVFGLLLGEKTGALQAGDTQGTTALWTVWIMAMSFYFGTTHSSQRKDATIARMK